MAAWIGDVHNFRSSFIKDSADILGIEIKSETILKSDKL